MRGRFGGCRHYLVPRGSALNEIRDGGRIDLRHRLLEASAELVKAPGDLNHQTVDRMGNDSHRSAPRLSIRSPSSREPTHTPRLQARAWPSGTVETRLASDNELNLLFRASDLLMRDLPCPLGPRLPPTGRTSRSPAATPTAAMRPSPRSETPAGEPTSSVPTSPPQPARSGNSPTTPPRSSADASTFSSTTPASSPPTRPRRSTTRRSTR